jgi:tetratricopeptide (TPR) repeat protein
LRRQLMSLTTSGVPTLVPRRSNPQLSQLSGFADRLYEEKKWLAAEKAYLNVLKIDHKNITAYVHLGIIYSTQKNMPDAIECFSIATRLKPSGSTFQNLALAFYDNRNYIKSIAAYEKAIMLEPHAQRYVGLGKAHLKLHNVEAAISAFASAAELDPSVRTLQRLADAYDEAGRKNDAQATYHRMHLLYPSDRIAARRLGIIFPDSDRPGQA